MLEVSMLLSQSFSLLPPAPPPLPEVAQVFAPFRYVDATRRIYIMWGGQMMICSKKKGHTYTIRFVPAVGALVAGKNNIYLPGQHELNLAATGVPRRCFLLRGAFTGTPRRSLDRDGSSACVALVWREAAQFLSCSPGGAVYPVCM